MNPKFKAVLLVHFSPPEVQQIEDFIGEKRFSPDGELVICSIFIFAKEQNKGLEDVFIACRVEWEKNWKFQHPAIKGDPNAPGVAGTQNRASLCSIYSTLEIPNPQE